MEITYENIMSYGNLIYAYKKAMSACKDPEHRAYHFVNQEQVIVLLRRQLEDGTYQPGALREFTVYDPKKRKIHVPPFIDRVLHHALYAVIKPVLEPVMHPHSFACRKGLGSHRARALCQDNLKKYQYVLKGDIHQYFASIDHKILFNFVKEKITKNERVLQLFEKIIRSYHTEGRPGKGLPIGSLTSQTFANLYLTSFDFMVSKKAGVGGFVRYMDDWVVFCNSKTRLREVENWMRCYLQNELKLEWLIKKTVLTISRAGLPFLGYYLKPFSCRVNSRRVILAFRRLRQRARLYREGTISKISLESSWQGWRGHILATKTTGLLRAGQLIIGEEI